MAQKKKSKGRNLVPENADANTAVGRPETIPEDLLPAILDKYEVKEDQKDLDSVIVQGLPIEGFKTQLSLEYFVRNFLRIAHTASKPYDRMLALEKAAKLMGHWQSGEKSPAAAVGVSFNMIPPSSVEMLDKTGQTTGDRSAD